MNRSADKFIESIKSNAEINLEDGKYLLSSSKENNNNVYFDKVFDGRELVIKNIQNMCIRGTGKTVHLLTEPRYANVIKFVNCKNITLENIYLGHTINKGSCTGGVIKMIGCSNISINKCRLFGCGRIGIDAKECNGISFKSSQIYGCSEGIMEVEDVRGLEILDSKLYNNKGFDLIKIKNRDRKSVV